MHRTPYQLLFLSLLCGCGQSGGPTLEPLRPVTGAVGVELRIQLTATSGGAIEFDYSAPDLPDLKSRKLAPGITVYAAGAAVFRWTPIAEDVGPHEIDFIATTDRERAVAPVVVTVLAGLDAAPVFRVPVGEGTTLELGRNPCAEVDVLVEDTDSTELEVGLEPPLVPNADYAPATATTGSLRFCPSPEQIAKTNLYALTLVADDGKNPRVFKPYTVVVRPPPMVVCTSKPPVITTAPHADITTTGNLHIAATISDDLGVFASRVLWSTTPPANPKQPDLGAFQPLPLGRKTGDGKSGAYEAVIPNPVVTSPSGATKRIYYVVAAFDDDMPQGCAHQTVSPGMGVFSFLVTRP
ncbi:MAG: hypothetical protein EXR72_22095 [Myxococcales bacterium]|nr:hypothetical protein [Myxococcales bacterium]